MNKRKKYGIIFAIVVFIVIFVIAFLLSVEVNVVYKKISENAYILETVKKIQPFYYGTNNIINAWFIGIIVVCVSLYLAFVKIKKKDINKAQIIVLGTIAPIILFISFLTAVQLLDIPTLAVAWWFFIVVTLILIGIFEYDLFGNKTIIFFFDFKLLIKMFFLFIILFFIIGFLGGLISPFTKTTTSPITKEQYENYKGEKIDLTFTLPKPTYKP